MNSQVWVILNDIQIPFEDKRVLNLVLDFIKHDLQPHGVILNGDITDCYSVSDFTKNPATKADIDLEIQRAGWLMDSLKDCHERIWLGGNHEDRIRRYEWKRIPELANHPKLSFPSLFNIEDHGFIWKEYGESHHLGKLMVTHGDLVSKHSAWSGKMTFDKYGTSVMMGHTHRLGVYYRRDVRGIHGAWENGCLCRLDPEYVKYPNWMQGFSIVHLGGNGLFSVQQIPILPGPSFMYGGQKIGKK